MVPDAVLIVPALLGMPPLLICSVPDWTSMVPALVSVQLSKVEVPPPALFDSVPVLTKVVVPTPAQLKPLLSCRSQVPLLLIVPPLPPVSNPLICVAVPWLLSVRALSVLPPPVLRARLAPGATVVEPVPDIVPAVQLSAVFAVNVPEPLSVPLVRLSVPTLTVPLSVKVPPFTVIAPVPLIVSEAPSVEVPLLKLSTPPALIVVVPLSVPPPLPFTRMSPLMLFRPEVLNTPFAEEVWN